MRKTTYLLLLLCSLSFGASANTYLTPAECQRFIDQHADMAVNEMMQHRIPASITLAQAILESSWGQGQLAVEGKNLFGIKCLRDWNGPCISKKDDEKGLSTFRKYNHTGESFADRSVFLKDDRKYAACFALAATDFAGWARELKRAKYASDSLYDKKLLALIAKYHLDAYDLAEQAAPATIRTEPAVQPAPARTAVHTGTPVTHPPVAEDVRTAPAYHLKPQQYVPGSDPAKGGNPKSAPAKPYIRQRLVFSAAPHSNARMD